MGIVFFGQRAYGRVMSHGGEYAESVFFHIQFLPLFPIRSRWVTRNDGAGAKHGFDTRLHLRSVVAAYLRWWAPIAACAAASLGVAGAILAIALFAACAWSWTWAGRLGHQAKRRSDMDRLAFGHRCEPTVLEPIERDRLSLLLSSRLARQDGARPPDDVARFGARNVEEAIAAYGMLRLSPHAESRAAADQLMSHAFDAMPADGGPFRTAAASEIPAAQSAIAEAIRAEIAAEQARYQLQRARRPKRFYQKPGMQLVGLSIMTLSAASMSVTIHPATKLTGRDLEEVIVPTDRVQVACDSVAPPSAYRFSTCQLGDRQLPVMLRSSSTTETTLYGRLRRLPSRGLAADDFTSQPARAYAYYLVLEDPSSFASNVIWVLGCDALVLAGWVLWIRAFRRRRAERRQPATR